MTTTSRLRAVATAAGLTTAVTTLALAGPAAAADGVSVAPPLLPVAQAVTRAADVSPAGVVVGTGVVNDAGGTLAYRWQPRGPGYFRQRLAAPPGLPYASATGVTDRGEAGGNAFDAVSRTGSYRWSTNGRVAPALLEEPSAVAAVGPGEWLVNQGEYVASTSTIVARDGSLTPITGLPTGTGMGGMSLGGPQTALVAVRDGIGQGSSRHPYGGGAGAAQGPPAPSAVLLGPARASP